MSQLFNVTRAQLPVLETNLRQWRLSTIASLDSESSQRRRIEREAARLLSLVVVLREDMSRGSDRVNAVNAVLPFIEVARSPVAGTEVKSSSVECLTRLMSAVTEVDDGAVEALSAVTEAILECRFEQTNSDADEVAMMWLLEGLASCVRLGGVGKLLPEEVLFRVVETMFDGCTAPFNSETTRAIALKLLTQFLKELFAIAPFGSAHYDHTAGSAKASDIERPTSRGSTLDNESDDTVEVTTANTTLAARKAYGFLVSMADPEHVSQAQAIGSWGRFVALRLLVEATAAACSDEEGVRIAKDPVILGIIKDDLMRTLIQTAQTVGSMTIGSPQTASASEDHFRLPIVSEALRLANILLGNATSRKELKIQFECFFNAVYARVLERTATRRLGRPDEAVLVIESLCDLLSDPTILCDSFVSFDLHLQSTDLFESTFKLFSTLAFPHQLSVPALDGFRLLSLRGLLIALRSLTVPRTGESNTAVEDSAAALEEERHARDLKARKLALHRCADAFNAKPKQGLKVLMDEGVLSDPPDPLIFASFLRNTPTLEKVAIGQFLGEDGELNRAVLRSFAETFDVRNMSLVAALRTFLECFRLPKEAQQIDRIVQAFADIAIAQSSDSHYFATVDACYILCFAIIMLNTDLHNPNIRPEKKMTVQQFITNNRNYGDEVSKGVNLPAEFLTSIYVDIAKREINTMKDGSGITAEISRDRWHDLLSRNRESRFSSSLSLRASSSSTSSTSIAPPQQVVSTAEGYKKVMFEAVWRPALAAVSVVFDSGQASEQPDALHSALDGFLTLAKAAAKFHCREAFDSVVASLCKFTSLLMYGSDSVELVEGSRAFNNALRDFGNHHKGQMAAMSVFALTRRFGSEIRKAWRHVLWCVLRLNDLRLLPEPFRSEESAPLDFAARNLFHRKMREHILKLHDVRMKRRGASSNGMSLDLSTSTSRGLSSSSSSSRDGTSGGGSGSGWGFASWLFGSMEDDEARSASRAEADEEHRAMMSALRVADAFCSASEKKKSSSSTSLGSPKGHHHGSSPSSPDFSPGRGGSRSAATSPTGSHKPSHHHHHHFESSDVLAGDAEEIFSRVDDGPASMVASQYAHDCVRSCRPFGIVAESKSLSNEALLSLIDALFHGLGVTEGDTSGGGSNADVHAGAVEGGEQLPGGLDRQESSSSLSGSSAQPVNTIGGKSSDELGVDLLAPPSAGSRLVAIHLLCELVLRNSDRFRVIYPRVFDGLFELIRRSSKASGNTSRSQQQQASKQQTFEVELACVALLRVCSGMFQLYPQQLVVALQTLVTEAFPVAPGLDFLLGRVVLDLVSNREVFWVMPSGDHNDKSKASSSSVVFTYPKCGWGEFFSLLNCLAAGSHVSASFAFDALKFCTSLLTTTASTTDNQPMSSSLSSCPSTVILDCARCANAFSSVRWPQGEQSAREAAVVDLVFSLLEFAGRFLVEEDNDGDEEQFVSQTWIPLLGELARTAQSETTTTATRKRSLGLLQRACLYVTPKDRLSAEEWTSVLELVVFPACNFALREGESGPSSPLMKGGETKSLIAACELLAKVILMQFKTLSQKEQFPELWVEVLQFLERFKHTGLIRASGGEPEGNALSEIVTELVKNLLLSMSTEQILSPLARIVATGQPLSEEEEEMIPPPNAPASLLWEMSWAVLDRSPGLRSDLFPLNDEIDLREASPSTIPQETIGNDDLKGEEDEEEALPEAPPLLTPTEAVTDDVDPEVVDEEVTQHIEIEGEDVTQQVETEDGEVAQQEEGEREELAEQEQGEANQSEDGAKREGEDSLDEVQAEAEVQVSTEETAEVQQMVADEAEEGLQQEQIASDEDQEEAVENKVQDSVPFDDLSDEHEDAVIVSSEDIAPPADDDQAAADEAAPHEHDDELQSSPKFERGDKRVVLTQGSFEHDDETTTSPKKKRDVSMKMD